MKKISLLLFMFLLLSSYLSAQQDIFWRNEATTGNWWDGSNPWYRPCDTWWIARPDYNVCYNNSTIGGNYIHFDNNNQLAMSVNGAWFKLLTLTFETTATTARTLTADVSGGLSFTSATSYITNLSTATHVLSTGIGVDNSALIINASGGPLTLNNPIFVNANAITFTGTYNHLVNGIISGSGTLTKSGSGTLTLNETNTYTGLTTISAGTLKLNKTGGTTIPITNNVTVNGGTLQISSNQTIANLDLNTAGSLIVDNGVTLTITGTYTSGTGTINNQGTIILQGASAQGFPGASTTINNGTANQMANLTINNSAGVSINKTFTASNVVVNPGSKLDINSGITLTATNFTLQSSQSGGTATLKNNGTLTATTTNVQQYLTNQSWYLTSPVNGTVTPTNLSRIQSYIEGSGTGNDWSTSGTTMEAYKGYITTVSDAPKTVEFTGTINSGSISIPLTRQAAGNENKYGFNLIGNPYTAYLDWNAVATANVTKMPTATMWYRTRVSNSWAFTTVNGTVASPANASYLIPPMQAFWVRASGTGNTTLDLTNNMVLQDNNTGNKLKAPAAANTNRQMVRLQVSNSTNTDELVIYTDANALNSFDTYDSPKMSNESVNIPEISCIIGAEYLVINGLNSLILDTTLPLRFMTKTANAFTLKANEVSNLPEGVKVILSDYGTEFDLTSGTEYNFTSDIADNTSRFSLVFRTKGTATGGCCLGIFENNVRIQKNESNQIVVNCDNVVLKNATIAVYNAAGQKLMQQNIQSSTTTLATEFKAGVYLVKLQSEGKVYNVKVAI